MGVGAVVSAPAGEVTHVAPANNPANSQRRMGERFIAKLAWGRYG